MSQSAINNDTAAAINPYSQKVAHLRQQILNIFLEDDRFVETVLGEASESDRLSHHELHEKSPLLENYYKIYTRQILQIFLKPFPMMNV